ncbi:D-glycero-beta-D-manno-heptose-7-phosphate kinase [Poriferisphaera sp. WC338]|uniref:D-glycero-beta-D-manno-heptose-7-phosphate kinase n=1 Tax=Poriferisphaera sp. WC338 TaxID=3425129 RepID=UPI003D819F90
MSERDAFVEPTLSEVESLLKNCLDKRIAVVGDAMLDAYIMGTIGRISPEAPVPVLDVKKEEWMLGGAANVAKCLVALGAYVRMCSVVGDDADGRLFADELANMGIDGSAVVIDKHRPTTRKTRIIAKQQQVVRLDQEARHPIDGAVLKKLASKVKAAAKWADVIILSDYAKGVLTEDVCQAAVEGAKDKGKPVLVDPKGVKWHKYRGVTMVKPNRKEAELVTGDEVTDDITAQAVADKIAKSVKCQQVLITRGSAGMSLITGKGKAKKTLHVHAQQHEVFDVTGAGDVVISVIALAMAGGAEVQRAVWLANVAAGVKVTKFGAATVTGQEMLEAIGGGEPDYQRKVMTCEQASGFAKKLRKNGKKIVFTNGCFDILHLGHVSYLERSRRCGDALIVGINTDESVTRLKGPGRPVQKEHDRAHIIASQACVDGVVLFGEDTPLELIKAVQPDVLTKGADYKRKQDVVGWDVVEKRGGKVMRIELVDGRSTTNLIEKSKK